MRGLSCSQNSVMVWEPRVGEFRFVMLPPLIFRAASGAKALVNFSERVTRPLRAALPRGCRIRGSAPTAALIVTFAPMATGDNALAVIRGSTGCPPRNLLLTGAYSLG